jgi:hypothetical protein
MDVSAYHPGPVRADADAHRFDGSGALVEVDEVAFTAVEADRLRVWQEPGIALGVERERHEVVGEGPDHERWGLYTR